MKMAKANEHDLTAALDISSAIESLHNGHLPDAMSNTDDIEYYDERKHAAAVIEHLLKITENASLFRVSFGMTVLLDPRNELVDPDADTLEVHPKYQKALEQRDELLAALKAAVDWGAPMAEAPVDSRPSWFDVARSAIAKVQP